MNAPKFSSAQRAVLLKSCSAKKMFYSGYFAGKIDLVLCVAGKMNYICQETFLENFLGTWGGVGCYIRNDIHWQRREDLEQKGIEAMWIEILVKNSKSFLVCIIYRPPDSSKYLDRNFEEKFDDMITTAMAENKETIIAGDMNCNYLDQLNHKAIRNTLKLNGFKQVINEATRTTIKTSTLIDVIITTDEQRISNQIVIANSISDHDLTGAIRKMTCEKFKPGKIYSRSYAKYNSEEFKADLRELPWEKVIKEKEVNSAWYIFKQLLSSVIDKHASHKEKIVRGRDCRWLTREIRGKINECDYLLKKAKRSK